MNRRTKPAGMVPTWKLKKADEHPITTAIQLYLFMLYGDEVDDGEGPTENEEFFWNEDTLLVVV